MSFANCRLKPPCTFDENFFGYEAEYYEKRLRRMGAVARIVSTVRAKPKRGAIRSCFGSRREQPVCIYVSSRNPKRKRCLGIAQVSA